MIYCRKRRKILREAGKAAHAPGSVGALRDLRQMPTAAVNIEFHNTLVPHFQQKRLASFLVRDIGALHDLMDLERLFAQGTQDIVAVIQHVCSSPSPAHITDSTKAPLPSRPARPCRP